ncbi:MAG: cell division protein ZapA [Peptococcaceae bacterium]|jgi:cell division protein ZapA (FtsZ GTPase activity inhibitor)|nr:cell division protein ZapA [Peptococcaceae bacterium]
MAAEEDNATRVKISIMDEEFTIRSSDADEAHMFKIAARLNEAIRTVWDANRNFSPKTAVILAAFNLVDRLVKVEDDYQTLIDYLERSISNETRNTLSGSR